MSDKGIKKYDEKGNLIYEKNFNYEIWYKYDDRNNNIYYRQLNNFGTYYEEWRKYDEDNNEIYYRDTRYFLEGSWHKYGENGEYIKEITEKEYKEIEFRKKEKEYLSRKKCSRFELMEI